MQQRTYFGFVLVMLVCMLVYMFQYKKFSTSHMDHKIPKPDLENQQDTLVTASISHNSRRHFKRFPNAIIIGVKKGGTKALLDMLCSHPIIKGCKTEPQFFSFHFQNGLKWYIDQMPFTGEGELTIEKSPNYFNVKLSPQRIYNTTLGRIKLILIVVNPITRAISDYVHIVSLHMKGNPSSSFEEKIVLDNGTINVQTSEIYKSMYDIHYQRWLEWFKKEQIFVMNGEELITNPASQLSKIEEFLNVPHYFNKEMFHFDDDKGFYCWNSLNKEKGHPQKNITTDLKCLLKSKGRQHPTVSQDTLDRLKVFLRPHTERFCSLASVNFSWCNL